LGCCSILGIGDYFPILLGPVFALIIEPKETTAQRLSDYALHYGPSWWEQWNHL